MCVGIERACVCSCVFPPHLIIQQITLFILRAQIGERREQKRHLFHVMLSSHNFISSFNVDALRFQSTGEIVPLFSIFRLNAF